MNKAEITLQCVQELLLLTYDSVGFLTNEIHGHQALEGYMFNIVTLTLTFIVIAMWLVFKQVTRTGRQMTNEAVYGDKKILSLPAVMSLCLKMVHDYE